MWFLILPLIVIIAFIILRGLAKESKEYEKVKKKLITYCIFFFILATIFGTLLSVIVIVPAGHVGVHDLFGSVRPTELPMGMRTKNPFAHVEMMDIKTHEIKEESEVPSKEGLLVRLDTSILYRIKPTYADEIYKTIGKWYQNVVIVPQLRSVIREVTAQFEAKALYTTARLNITQEIFNALDPKLDERGIILESVLLRDLGLPLKLTEAIELKLTAEQQIEQKEFEVAREFQEAERKRVEAKGIADANEIIAESLTQNYLTWYWIENLESHNSVLYVPVGDGGLPIFKQVD